MNHKFGGYFIYHTSYECTLRCQLRDKGCVTQRFAFVTDQLANTDI